MMDICSNCGSDKVTVVRGDYVYRESGLENVVLKGIELIRCPKCGNEDPIIPRIGEVQKTIALAVVNKPAMLTGSEIRFLRKYLHLTGEKFSRLLQVNNATLSKWENNADPVGPQSERLIRAIALSLGEGLGEHIAESIQKFPDIATDLHEIKLKVDAEKQEFEYV